MCQSSNCSNPDYENLLIGAIFAVLYLQCFTPSTRSIGEILDIFNDKKKAHLITLSQQLKEYLSSLQKKGLIAYQRGEQFIERHARDAFLIEL